MRGLTLTELSQLDVVSLVTLIPRISSPAITPHEASKLDPADLMNAGGIILGFLMPQHVAALRSLYG
jgi:hypothetical protein